MSKTLEKKKSSVEESSHTDDLIGRLYNFGEGEVSDDVFDAKWLETNKKRINETLIRKKGKLTGETTKLKKVDFPNEKLVRKDVLNLVDRLVGFKTSKSEEEAKEQHSKVGNLYNKYSNVEPSTEEQRSSQLNLSLRKMAVSNPNKLKTLMKYRTELMRWKNVRSLVELLKSLVMDKEVEDILRLKQVSQNLLLLKSELHKHKAAELNETSKKKINERLNYLTQSILEGGVLLDSVNVDKSSGSSSKN